MDRLPFPSGAIAAAAFFAGPIFLFWLGLAFYVQFTPGAIAVSPGVFLIIPAALVAMIFGFFLAILPCAIGSMIMVRLSGNPLVRTPVAWLAAGFSLPIAAFWFWSGNGDENLLFALAATGGTCALICRRGADSYQLD